MYKSKNKKQNKKNYKKINTIILFVLASAVVLNVAIANFSANQSYEIAKYQEDKKVLQQDTETLSLRTTELRSMERLSQASASQNLVKADTIYYITPKGTVALSK